MTKAKKAVEWVPLSVHSKTRDDLATLKTTLGCKSVDATIRLLVKHGQKGAVAERMKELRKAGGK